MNRFTFGMRKGGDFRSAIDAARQVGLAVDVHQHLWPASLVEALRRRTEPPRLRGWTLGLAGEPDFQVDPGEHDVAARVVEAAGDGLDLALVSLSSPLGIESLPPAEARELLSAYHDGVHELPRPFRAWAAACLTSIDPDALQTQLDRGFAGLQLPATSLLDRRDYDHAAPLLELLQANDRPLFIHPGPVTGPGPARGGSAQPDRSLSSPPDQPPWWAPVVTYVQQMHAAWFAFRVYGRPRHPRLRVGFAMLAGLAPLHGERFAARGGGRTVVDPDVFLEISSYGTRAVDATIRVLGVDVLVNGSDRPYAAPVTPELGASALSALRSTNPLRFIGPQKEVLDDLALATGAQS